MDTRIFKCLMCGHIFKDKDYDGKTCPKCRGMIVPTPFRDWEEYVKTAEGVIDMDKKSIEQIVIATLEKCGINVPLEVKFDYTCTDEPAKAREFVRLTEGNWRNAIYVNKEGTKFGDAQYYDLLFVVDEGGEPLCIPVPVARQLFNADIAASLCKSTIRGSTYEAIYAKYYEKRSLPF